MIYILLWLYTRHENKSTAGVARLPFLFVVAMPNTKSFLLLFNTAYKHAYPVIQC